MKNIIIKEYIELSLFSREQKKPSAKKKKPATEKKSSTSTSLFSDSATNNSIFNNLKKSLEDTRGSSGHIITLKKRAITKGSTRQVTFMIIG